MQFNYLISFPIDVSKFWQNETFPSEIKVARFLSLARLFLCLPYNAKFHHLRLVWYFYFSYQAGLNFLIIILFCFIKNKNLPFYISITPWKKNIRAERNWTCVYLLNCEKLNALMRLFMSKMKTRCYHWNKLWFRLYYCIYYFHCIATEKCDDVLLVLNSWVIKNWHKTYKICL